jgi:GcrA cell cycle regulator
MMWTSEQDDQLRAMHAESPKPKCREMAERIGGVSKNAVIGRRRRIGLGGPKRLAEPRNRSPNRPKAEPRVSKRRMAMTFKDKLACPDTLSVGSAKSLLDLAPGDCRWPFGDKPFTFCGCRTFTSLPYCAGHARIAYGRVVAVRARTKVSRFGNWAASKVKG